jgi:hypothetical protein
VVNLHINTSKDITKVKKIIMQAFFLFFSKNIA